MVQLFRGDHFQFGLVFIKKSNQTDLKKKKPKPNRNRFKPTGFGSIRFVFLEQKLVQTSLARFFLIWLGLAQFFQLGRFGFFGFRLIKTKPNQTGWFFQNSNQFNRFFFTVQFFRLFFFQFSWFNRFFGVFTHPYSYLHHSLIF